MSPRFLAPWSLCLLIAGCGSPNDTQGPPPDPNNPFVSATQMTLRGNWQLSAGQERYQCFIFHWNRPGGVAVRKIIPHTGQAVHHVGVFTDPMKTETMAMRECEQMGLWNLVYGAGVGTGPLTFPTGTALAVGDGVPIILQMHLLNASGDAVNTTTTVDLELAESGADLQPVATWVLGTTDFSLPPKQMTNVDSTCKTHPKMEHAFAAFPHMHQLGTGLQVTSGADASTLVLQMAHWDFGNQGTVALTPEQTFPENIPIQTRCAYNNKTDKEVPFGLSTTDEMCAVAMYYYPAVGKPGLQICAE